MQFQKYYFSKKNIKKDFNIKLYTFIILKIIIKYINFKYIIF